MYVFMSIYPSISLFFCGPQRGSILSRFFLSVEEDDNQQQKIEHTTLTCANKSHYAFVKTIQKGQYLEGE
jgi:hypothetical protein